MTARSLGSRRTRQDGTTVAKEGKRKSYRLPPVAFLGDVTASSSGRLHVDDDIELHGAWISSIAGTSTSTFEIYRNGELLQSVSIGAAETYKRIFITSMEEERFLFSASNDYLYVTCTVPGGHKNVVIMFLAYENEGR